MNPRNIEGSGSARVTTSYPVSGEQCHQIHLPRRFSGPSSNYKNANHLNSVHRANFFSFYCLIYCVSNRNIPNADNVNMVSSSCQIFGFCQTRPQPPTPYTFFGNMYKPKKQHWKNTHKKHKMPPPPKKIRVEAWPTHQLQSFSRMFWFFNLTRPLSQTSELLYFNLEERAN